LLSETICVLIALWVLRRAFKRTCLGASYVAIFSSGIFERFLTQNIRGIRSDQCRG
jgi:hypothetical protein